MADLARKVIDQARAAQRVRARGRALAEAMRPHLGGYLYSEKTISDWIKGRVRDIPADALLAAAKVAGISLDELTGVGREPTAAERMAQEALARANEALERFRQWDDDHAERNAV